MRMKKEKWIVRLMFSDKFIIIAMLMVTLPLQSYLRPYTLLFLTVAICALVGLLLGRIIRLEEALKDLRDKDTERHGDGSSS